MASSHRYKPRTVFAARRLCFCCAFPELRAATICAVPRGAIKERGPCCGDGCFGTCAPLQMSHFRVKRLYRSGRSFQDLGMSGLSREAFFFGAASLQAMQSACGTPAFPFGRGGSVPFPETARISRFREQRRRRHRKEGPRLSAGGRSAFGKMIRRSLVLWRRRTLCSQRVFSPRPPLC